MKWHQVDDWHWKRECGRYTVSRALSFSDPKHPHGAWMWDAWFKPYDDAAPQQLNTEPQETRVQAIAICSAHVRSNSTRPAAA